ncbi:hypothetical protein VNI00_014274 [Paramarasmius palmivorus]|uniref:Nephrocystin 3-like N-terminal domain-containing protein n=1 Tax=Paramarasmius palmivorus TaxID=297713 RepID=A0AAW0BW47_9AGAR
MSFFPDARQFTVNHSAFNLVHGNQVNNFNAAESSKDRIIELVANYAAANAFYDSEQRFPPPNCLPGTRIEMLMALNNWIAKESSNIPVYWIYGPAGVGKSAILQNLSETHGQCRLAASFFFSRNDSTRDKLDPFVVTIVYQLLKSEPLRAALGSLIIDAIRSDPKIFQSSSENQFRKLILEPCCKVDPKEWQNLPNLVIIDGLDECILIPSQERLIAMIRRATQECPLIFLIASRPEPRICRAFEHDSFASQVRCLAVGDSYGTMRDITTYFHVRFSQLQDTHHALRHMDVSWPGENVIRRLVDRASGQFIFAATVMKYLESDDELPTERLEAILRIRAEDLPKSPYPDLDLLYNQILSACPKWDEVRKVLGLLLSRNFDIPLIIGRREYRGESIMGMDYSHLQSSIQSGKGISVSQERRGRRGFDRFWSAKVIEVLLNYDPGRLETLLFRLHSVIEVPSGSGNIHILHASFMEYLTDSKRSRDYHIQPHTDTSYMDLVVQAFLRAISLRSQEYSHNLFNSTPKLPEGNTLYIADVLKVFFIDEVLFAVFPLMSEVKTPSDELLRALNQFDPYPFATWLLNWQDATQQRGYFSAWKRAIRWAMSLRTKTPWTFLSNMEKFLGCFYIGSPGTSASRLSHATAFLERAFYATNAHQHDWCELVGHASEFGMGDDVYILPVDQTPPPSWLTFTTNLEMGESMRRLLVSLRRCEKHSLIQDIRNDTYNSVNDLVKHNDLYSLKKLVTRHRNLFGLSAHSCSPPITEDELFDAVVKLFHPTSWDTTSKALIHCGVISSQQAEAPPVQRQLLLVQKREEVKPDATSSQRSPRPGRQQDGAKQRTERTIPDRQGAYRHGRVSTPTQGGQSTPTRSSPARERHVTPTSGSCSPSPARERQTPKRDGQSTLERGKPPLQRGQPNIVRAVQSRPPFR